MLLSNMDESVRPQDDFFRFVNGKWLETVEIPADRERWGSFDELRKATDQQSQGLVDRMLSGDISTDSNDVAKVIDFIQVAMETYRIKDVGLVPLHPLLEEVSGITSIGHLADYNVSANARGLPSLWGASVFASMADSKRNAWYLGACSLGLPERDYYLLQDKEHSSIRQDYKAYIAELAGLMGLSIDAEAVLAWETAVAKKLLSKEESRNPQNIFNPRSLAQLEESTPGIPWSAIWSAYSLPSDLQPIITELTYFESLQELVQDFGVEGVKNYLRWTLINQSASYLAGAIEECRFSFYGRRLGGAEQMRPRKERVLNVVNSVLGEALGKLYVAEYFPPTYKERAVQMVELVREAFHNRLVAVTWMSDSTKEKALEKLAGLRVKIGYPDQWKDYAQLEVDGLSTGATYLDNILKVSVYRWRDNLEKLAQLVDPEEWYMAPQVVNAYYNPLANEVVFPAAILQPPFYHAEADMAINFGGIGAVIAHEITHGFDDRGRRFDEQGNMVEWWSSEDLEAFTKRGEALIEQADVFHILPDLTLNGSYTLGENMADLGGVLVSYDALQLYYKRHGRPASAGSYTGEQLFFMSWATVWRGKTREKALRKQVATDPHPPFEFRAVNPLRNAAAFAAVWGVGEGDQMYLEPSQRAEVW